MPWKATDAMKERANFVLEWERRWNEARGGPVDMAELCRKYGVSRPSGYGWVKRFRDASRDLRAVEEKSRRPQSNPHAISPEVEDWAPRLQRRPAHEALGEVPPALVRRSPRRYPRKLIKPDPPAWREACDVDRYGCIRWRKRKLFVTSALSGEIVELQRSGETTWQIRFLDLVIGSLDERTMERGILMKRKPQPAEL